MKAKTFSGGFKFRGFKGQPNDALADSQIPRKVIIPLAQGFGNILEPMVKVGDSVKAGQIVARNDESISSPAHASISGRVVSIEKKNFFNREVPMVEIEGDGSAEYEKIPGHSADWEKLPVEKLEELLYTSGVTALDRDGIPTSFKSSVTKPKAVSDIIIHCIGSEIYNISLETLLAGKGLEKFIEGMKILRKVMSSSRIHLALNKDKKHVVEKIKSLTSELPWLNIYALAPKYPQGYDELLVPSILGKEFPFGYSAADIGVIVINVQAVIQSYEAVAEGKPLIERTVALCGPSMKNPQHIKVRVGTPLEQVLEGRLKGDKVRVVLRSLLTGFDLNDHSLPIDKTFSQIIAIPDNDDREFLAFLRPGLRDNSFSNSFLSSYVVANKTADTNLYGEERPCVQCGYCISVCPVKIYPTLLDRYLRVKVDETLLRYKIYNRIECNLCSYVCPSKIPLGSNLRKGKMKMVEVGCDQYSCIKPKYDLQGLDEYKGVKVVR
jgi:Na(+)-translocating NADH:ubiquinone oxidoreductase A subunit